MDLLPDHILERIFEHLDHSDRKCAKLVSCKFYHLCFSKPIMKNTVLVVRHDISEMADYNYFERFIHLNLSYINFSEQSTQWIKQGLRNIQTLTFNSCTHLTEQVFCKIFEACSNLKCLEIISSELWFSNQEETIVNFSPKYFLLQLTTLIIQSTDIIDIILAKFLNLAPNLQNLHIKSFSTPCHINLYKRFYPSCLVRQPSNSIFSFLYVEHHIKTVSEKIKSLNFSSSKINSRSLLSILTINKLVLTELDIASCYQVNASKLEHFMSCQPELTSLNISSISGDCDQLLKNICEDLPRLRTLNISKCNFKEDICLQHLAKLEHLEILLADDINVEIPSREENAYISLPYLKSLAITDSHRLVQSLKLSTFSLSNLNCLILINNDLLDDDKIQIIFENMEQLQILNLENCSAISDAGMLGISNEDNGIYIEQKITESQFSITNLQRLKTLHLGRARGLTNLTIKYGLKFPNLRYLNLLAFKDVMVDACHALACNVKTLETLNLQQCTFTNEDECKDVIRKGLKRLNIFNI